MSATMTLPGAAAEGPKLFPLRKRTGTAPHHMSKAAVGFGLDDLDALTQKGAVFFMAVPFEARFEVFVFHYCY